jgi:hypothetical protein
MQNTTQHLPALIGSQLHGEIEEMELELPERRARIALQIAIVTPEARWRQTGASGTNLSSAMRNFRPSVSFVAEPQPRVSRTGAESAQTYLQEWEANLVTTLAPPPSIRSVNRNDMICVANATPLVLYTYRPCYEGENIVPTLVRSVFVMQWEASVRGVVRQPVCVPNDIVRVWSPNGLNVFVIARVIDYNTRHRAQCVEMRNGERVWVPVETVEAYQGPEVSWDDLRRPAVAFRGSEVL